MEAAGPNFSLGNSHSRFNLSLGRKGQKQSIPELVIAFELYVGLLCNPDDVLIVSIVGSDRSSLRCKKQLVISEHFEISTFAVFQTVFK